MMIVNGNKSRVIREVLEATCSSSARSGRVSAARRGPLAPVENARRERSIASGTRLMRLDLNFASNSGPERRLIHETADKADGAGA